MPCNADLSGLFVDQTKYIAVVKPKTMQPAFETFLKYFASKCAEMNDTNEIIDDEDEVELEDSVETKQQKFLVEYGELKQKNYRNLENLQ
jgi:hypothetical protein